MNKPRAAAGRDVPSIAVRIVVLLGATTAFLSAAFIIGYILLRGLAGFTLQMLSPSYNSRNYSMLPALINTVTVLMISLAVVLPAGVCAAVYLSEYAGADSRFASFVRLTADTLSGVPSIIYGLFGGIFFVRYLGLGLSLLSGSLTMAIMLLPVIMRTAEQAIAAVPDSLREGSLALGAGRLRTVFCVVLPSAAPGIFSGVALAAGRITGESAALIFTAGTAAGTAESLMQSGRTLSVHMYALACEGVGMEACYASAAVLLIVSASASFVSHVLSGRFGSKEGY